MKQTNAYAAYSATTALSPYSFERRAPGEHDVQIEILYCGVCHSDLHTARNEWEGSTFPVVPGHEIVGRVTHIGDKVKIFHVGDFAAVGCMVDACRTCYSCKENLEQYCENETIYTYNSPDKYSQHMTYGGYSERIVVDESFVLRIPKEFQEKDLARVAPLLCAGITTYSPLRHWNCKKGSQVAIIGLGGLGHMAIKIAAHMGAHVTLFTTSENKRDDAKKMGAHHVVISKQKDEVKKYNNSFDLIINTVSAPHDLDMYVDLLKRDATMCLVGLPSQLHPSPNVSKLILKRKAIAGSLIGGIKETQEMLNFCAQHNILCDIELIPIQKINEAYERMLKSDVKYRFVVDIASIRT